MVKQYLLVAQIRRLVTLLAPDLHVRTGLIDKNFTLDRVINDRILKLAQQELKAEGKLRQ